jgi:hypothetical protein
MVSVDTVVHVAVVVLALALLSALNAVADFGQPVAQVALFVVFYGLVLGGAHFILALRGRNGIVPVASRWRFLGLVAVIILLGSVSLVVGPVDLGPVSSSTVLTVLGVGAVAGYWLLEARDGYRDAAGPQ